MSREATAVERLVSEAAIMDLIAEMKAHRKTRRDLRAALIVGTFNALLLVYVSVAYLRTVNLPQPHCLHPAFVPTQIETVQRQADVEVWL
jgi:hypothetical protein